MKASPAPIPLARPVALTSRTLVPETLHCACPVTSRTEASDRVTLAVSWTDSPVAMFAGPTRSIFAMETGGLVEGASGVEGVGASCLSHEASPRASKTAPAVAARWRVSIRKAASSPVAMNRSAAGSGPSRSKEEQSRSFPCVRRTSGCGGFQRWQNGQAASMRRVRWLDIRRCRRPPRSRLEYGSVSGRNAESSTTSRR